MPEPKTYATAGAFRKALEERLRTAALTEQVDLNRLRRQVSFDRLLARLFREEPAPWALKGGYALELRFKMARATVDIDLTLPHLVATMADGDANQAVRAMLQNKADLALGDWFEYVIGPPAMDLTAAPYGGSRYSVEAREAPLKSRAGHTSTAGRPVWGSARQEIDVDPKAAASGVGQHAGATAVARLTISAEPSAEMRAGHSGHMPWMARSHSSSFSRKRRGLAYSTFPSCAAKPRGPKIGTDSSPFAAKQRYESHMNRSRVAGADDNTRTASMSVGIGCSTIS